MEMKPIWAGAVFFAGWLIFYLPVRQIVFNFSAAYPTIKNLRSRDRDIVAPGADKYTLISVIVCTLVFLAVSFAVVRFCKLYLIISFFVGIFVGLVMYLPSCRIKTRSTFDLFCSAYYRFIPDDELRTAMYERDPKAIKKRLRNMGQDDSFIPDFSK